MDCPQSAGTGAGAVINPPLTFVIDTTKSVKPDKVWEKNHYGSSDLHIIEFLYQKIGLDLQFNAKGGVQNPRDQH